MARLTARKLELYDMPGKGAAANAISAAVTKATAVAIRAIGRHYAIGIASRAIARAVTDHVCPVQLEHSAVGAYDSEPSRAVYSEVCNRVAKRYRLAQHENDALYYATY